MSVDAIFTPVDLVNDELEAVAEEKEESTCLSASLSGVSGAVSSVFVNQVVCMCQTNKS